MRIHRQKVVAALIPWLIMFLARLWFGTVRVRIADKDVFDLYFTNGRDTGHVVAGAWHRNAIFFFYYFRKLQNSGIMISSRGAIAYPGKTGQGQNPYIKQRSATPWIISTL